jgi:hypothetical protein
MRDTFSGEDRGKVVRTANGARIGTIATVEDGRATVDRDDPDDDGLMADVKSLFGWESEEDDEIRDEHVEEYREDEIRLRGH